MNDEYVIINKVMQQEFEPCRDVEFKVVEKQLDHTDFLTGSNKIQILQQQEY